MIKIRVFCESDHDRVQMEFVQNKQWHICQLCLAMITDEVAFRAIPVQYRKMVGGVAGELLAAMADIGAFDVIYRGHGILLVEYPRENQV